VAVVRYPVAVVRYPVAVVIPGGSG
jgi:hypothetical protein